MARLLVSVRTAAEAEAAVRGGADMIDVKEPGNGALGRAADAVIPAVVRAARGLPVSVALGELIDGSQSGGRLPPLDGVRFAKVGLAGSAAQPDWAGVWRSLHRRIVDATDGRTKLIAVAYADCTRASAPAIDDVFALAVDASCDVLLVDTWGKDGRGLLDWMGTDELTALSTRCAECGLGLALAGSLGPTEIASVLPVGPAIVAVRGAACQRRERTAPVDASRVRRLARLVHAVHPTGSTPPAVPAGS